MLSASIREASLWKLCVLDKLCTPASNEKKRIENRPGVHGVRM